VQASLEALRKQNINALIAKRKNTVKNQLNRQKSVKVLKSAQKERNPNAKQCAKAIIKLILL
jgi:hypothetical protein